MAVKITLTPEQYMYLMMLMTAALEEIMDKVSQMNHDEVMKGIAQETVRKSTLMTKIEDH